MYGIANSGVYRSGSRSKASSPSTVAAVYVTASATAGLVTGALLGLLGSAIALDVRAAAVTALALLAVGVGLAGIGGRHMTPPLQCDRETPRDWVERGGIGWGVRNGLSLGFGGTTRIGFALWYAIGFGALLAGSWPAGAIIYGSYGFTRGAGALVLMAVAKRTSADQVGFFVLKHYDTSIQLAAVQTLVVGVAVLAVSGV